MKVKTVVYTRFISKGHREEAVGVEVELAEGDSPDMGLLTAKEAVEGMLKRHTFSGVVKKEGEKGKSF